MSTSFVFLMVTKSTNFATVQHTISQQTCSTLIYLSLRPAGMIVLEQDMLLLWERYCMQKAKSEEACSSEPRFAKRRRRTSVGSWSLSFLVSLLVFPSPQFWLSRIFSLDAVQSFLDCFLLVQDTQVACQSTRLLAVEIMVYLHSHF